MAQQSYAASSTPPAACPAPPMNHQPALLSLTQALPQFIIEVAHRGVFQRRAQRTEYLRALGFRVLQFTPEQLLAEPESLLKALRMVLRAKAQVA